MNLSKNHFIYKGTIRHRRYEPFKNIFSYPLFLTYIDLERLDNITQKSWLWNVNKPAIVSFNRKDYHGDPRIDLRSAVRDTVQKRTGTKLDGPIRLLTHLRYFGFCFNPVSFYYCFDNKDTQVEVIMAEVTNTPWNERHAYIIHDKENDVKFANLKADLEKKLHVSPFWGMDHNYEWLFTQPGKNILVNMKNYKNDIKVFDATLQLHRIPFNYISLINQLIRFPFITVIVVFRIHWQAAKLWLKRAPFFVHPKKRNERY